jgi:hypothetical protein
MENYILLLAVVASGMFAVQFLMLLVGADVDLDFNSDFSIGDVLSFKGVVHFFIGFGWFMYLYDDYSPLSWVYGVGAGLVFVLVLYGCYRLMFSMKAENIQEKNEELVGREARIYHKTGGAEYRAHIQVNGALRIRAIRAENADTEYFPEQSVKITKCENGILYFI